MKKLRSPIKAILALLILPLMSFGQARVQVIHNSADAAASVVDVWLNDQLLIDDFAFRTATPFVDAPSGVDFDVVIQPSTSTDTTNALARFTYNLMEGNTYILVASGIVSQSGYDPPTPFNIHVYDMGRETAESPSNIDVLLYHGVTDAPGVDFLEELLGVGNIVDGLEYGNFFGYVEIPADDYVLTVTDGDGNIVIGPYEAPLDSMGLDGQAIVVLASGFLDPSSNSDGPGFGLYVALPTGGPLVMLPLEIPTELPTAWVQVIHNSSDAAASEVDVWLNDILLIDDFAFRTATPFIIAPAGEEFDVVIQPSNSTDTTNALARFTYTLEEGKKYVLVASGIVSQTGYEPATPFDIHVYDMGRTSASSESNTDVLVYHGSTDAPVVDIVETGVGAGALVDDIAYSEFEGYLELPTADYIVAVRDQTGETTVASYMAPLETLGLEGQALVVLASGFLDPSTNNDGEAFGLYAALVTGGPLVELPLYTEGGDSTARVQVIHNSADGNAKFVDVWINNQLLLDDFEFRTASPFVDVPAGVEFDVVIQSSNSTDTTNSLARFTYNLTAGSTYILVANGIVVPDGYNPATPFDIYVYDMGREAANSPDNSDVLVFHGSTDAPVVDIVETGVGAGTLVNDLAYGEFDEYLELLTDDYVIEVREESDTISLAAYSAPLETLELQGQAMVVLASGFLDPTVNNNCPAFGLFVALPSGGDLVELPLYIPTAIVNTDLSERINLFPVPAVSHMEINSPERIGLLRITNITGAEVFRTNVDDFTHKLAIDNLKSGIYILQVDTERGTAVKKFTVR